MKAQLTCLVAAIALLAGGAAQAGRSCEGQRLSVQDVTQGMALAARTATDLDAAHARDGTRVVMLARAGQDLSKYRQTWSHVGWAYRSSTGQWRVLHKLNHCGTDQSVLMRQGLGQFFLDQMWRYEARWEPVPTAWQDGLWALLQDNARAARLHQPRYSMVAYAWGTRYQQSNQWAIETLALAAEPGLHSRTQAQAWLQLKDYRPPSLRIGALSRLGGRMTRANVAFDDHPTEQRFADRIQTVTADSVLDWLAQLKPPQPPQPPQPPALGN